MAKIKTFESSTVVKTFFRQFSLLRMKLLDLLELQKFKLNHAQQFTQLFFDRMFILQFIQSNKFFENNPTYLQNKYEIFQNQNLNYYSTFFLPFLFEKLREFPILNIELFSKQQLDLEYQNIEIPNDFFIRCFEFMNAFSWELVETQETEEQHHITPEILGFIFEQTLNARSESGKGRKETGTYYTPKQITSFITHKIISGYLENKFQKESSPVNLQEFYDQPNLRIPEELGIIFFSKIFPKLSILDNSCGSGAFILTALDELVIWIQEFVFSLYSNISNYNKIVEILEIEKEQTKNLSWQYEKLIDFQSDPEWRFWIKRKIIKDHIFGVDLDETAVQITKVRLWLSILTEQIRMKKTFGFSTDLNQKIKAGNALFGIISNDQVVENDLSQKQLDSIYWKQNLIENIKFDQKPMLFHWVLAFPTIFLNTRTPGFAIIIGNPPYGDLLSPCEKQLCQQLGYSSTEIAASFLERSLDLQQEDGFLGQITTFAITFSKELSPTRKKIVSSYNKAQIASFDRDKCRFFVGMTQSVAIIFCYNYHKKTPPDCAYGKIYSSKMYRTMPDLNTLEFEDTTEWLLGKIVRESFDEIHRLPKIGQKIVSEILTQLIPENQLNYETIEDLFEKSKKTTNLQKLTNNQTLWVRISGNYWYNAWDFHPYESTQIIALKLNSNKQVERSFMILLMNSSLFYLWCRIYGDGRHMNIDILNAFPFSTQIKQKIQQNEELINTTASWLMNIMHQHYDPVRKCFPSSKFKYAIDFCDEILSILYNLPFSYVKYIQNYDTEIRGGNFITEIQHKKILKLWENYSFIEFNQIMADFL